MTPEQYAALGGKPPAEDEDHMHAGAEGGHGEMAGMDMGGSDAAPAHEHGDEKGPAHSHDNASAAAAAPSKSGMKPKAAPEAEAVAEALHTALQKGDRNAVLTLLAPDVAISEGGETQTRKQYETGHLSDDIAFLKTAQVKPVSMGSMPMGDTAMVGSRSEIRATHDGKPVALLSTEMLTLRKESSGWLITKIEWASDKVPK
jgi:ketosteroid isomerase-like protein